jgi:hypothetical protein
VPTTVTTTLNPLLCLLHVAGVVELLPTLLDFRPETYGSPPFADLLPEGVTPVTPPVCIRGKVVKGFGRGSKVRHTSIQISKHPVVPLVLLLHVLTSTTASIPVCLRAHS